MSDNKGVMVYCEVSDGRLTPLTFELLGVGGRLARDLEQDLIAILIGHKVSRIALEVIDYGADKLFVVDDAILKDYLTDSYLIVMDRVINQNKPSILLFGQTQIGRDLAPRLAFRLDTSATLDCVALSIDSQTGRLLQTKPVYGGNALSLQYCLNDPQIATVRMKVMPRAEKNTGRSGEVINIPADIDPGSIRTRILDRKIEPAAGVKLEEAKIIVSGGRGIGSGEGFKQLEELATVLKGAVGASRPPCDNKWVPDNLQIGLTGKIVSPDVYIAVALSGSSQHLSGCSGSKVIVAINQDPEANIFKAARYGIIADWKKALPAFTSRIKEMMR
jgi:electron transfer flavoprotein alpha subunit